MEARNATPYRNTAPPTARHPDQSGAGSKAYDIARPSRRKPPRADGREHDRPVTSRKQPAQGRRKASSERATLNIATLRQRDRWRIGGAWFRVREARVKARPLTWAFPKGFRRSACVKRRLVSSYRSHRLCQVGEAVPPLSLNSVTGHQGRASAARASAGRDERQKAARLMVPVDREKRIVMGEKIGARTFGGKGNE